MYTEKGRDKLEKYKQTGVEDEEGLQAIIGTCTLYNQRYSFTLFSKMYVILAG